MSKIQTKINFVEKKKTSARLQQKFQKTDIKKISEINADSPSKEEKSKNKENELKVKVLCPKNPTLLIYRISPVKTAKANDIKKENLPRMIELSPSKRNSATLEGIQKESTISRSPLKEKTDSTITPTKQRKDHCTRSLTKKENITLLKEEPKGNNDSSVKNSPLKRQSPSKKEIEGTINCYGP